MATTPINKGVQTARSTPKTPVQERSIDRVARVLDAAEELVREHGTAGVSMKMISDASGVGRASVYQFFPSILAVWKGLALRYLDELQGEFERTVMSRSFERWEEAWDALIDTAVAYYNERPLAQSILLGTDGSHDLRLADPEYDKRYAEWISERLSHLFDDGRAMSVKHLRVNVTATTSLFSLSVWEHGAITPFYVSEIKRLSRAYTAALLADNDSDRAD